MFYTVCFCKDVQDFLLWHVYGMFVKLKMSIAAQLLFVCAVQNFFISPIVMVWFSLYLITCCCSVTILPWTVQYSFITYIEDSRKEVRAVYQPEISVRLQMCMTIRVDVRAHNLLNFVRLKTAVHTLK